MSNERERRLRMITELRQRELDKRARELLEARAREAEALHRLEQVHQQVERATEERKALVERGTNPEDWGRAELWIHTLRKREQVAAQQRAAAAAAVEQARVTVIEAQATVHRMETVVAKIARVNRLALERKERKLEDEFATRRALARREQRGR